MLRGLRAIVEDIMIDVMFDVPSDENISKVVITEDSIKSKKLPELIRLGENEVRPVLKTKKAKKRKGMAKLLKKITSRFREVIFFIFERYP